MRIQKGLNLSLAGLLLFVTFMGLSGCSALKSRSKGATPPAASAKSTQATPRYFEFEDVLIPGELKIVRGASFVFQAQGMTAGVLAFKGRVELHSLITFFEKNMVKDNWQEIASFKSPRTMMLFNKQNRWCVINIRDGELSTAIEIWISPSNGMSAGSISESGLLR